MVRATRPQLFVHRRRRRHPATFDIIVREELRQFERVESEDQDPRIRHQDDRRAIIGKATEGISSAKWYALVLAKLGLFLDLIQIMYQNRKDSPFETHPATMAISLAALCIFCFAAETLLNSKAEKVDEEGEQQTTGHFLNCRQILNMLVLILGALMLSCLVSIFVPNGVGWIVFVSCASTIFAVVVAWRLLYLPIFGRTKSGHGELGPSKV